MTIGQQVRAEQKAEAKRIALALPKAFDELQWRNNATDYTDKTWDLMTEIAAKHEVEVTDLQVLFERALDEANAECEA